MARKTITLAEVGLRQEKPGKNGMYSLLDVKGTDGLKYTLFKTAFMDLCKVGATLDAEVKEEQKEWQGNQFTNYTITEVYLDGQAVAGSKQGGGGRSYGKSPDERASIERQVAVKEVGEALRMGLPVTPEIQGAYWRIVAEWLNAPQSAPAGQGAASASNPIPTGQSGANFHADRDGYRIVIPTGIPQPRTSRDDAAELDRNFEGTTQFPPHDTGQAMPVLNSMMDFYREAAKLGMDSLAVHKKLNVSRGADIVTTERTLQDAWRDLWKG